MLMHEIAHAAHSGGVGGGGGTNTIRESALKVVSGRQNTNKTTTKQTTNKTNNNNKQTTTTTNKHTNNNNNNNKNHHHHHQQKIPCRTWDSNPRQYCVWHSRSVAPPTELSRPGLWGARLVIPRTDCEFREGRGGEEGRSVRDAVGHFAASSWRGKCPRKSSLKRSASRTRIEPGPSALHTTVWRRAPLAERAQAALTGG